MSDTHGGHHKPDVKLYLTIFGALLCLTVLTVLVSYWHLPIHYAVFVGLLIATIKAGLVAAFFMHLNIERKLIYGVLGVTVFFLIVLFTLPITDFRLLAPRTQHLAVAAEAEGAPAATAAEKP